MRELGQTPSLTLEAEPGLSISGARMQQFDRELAIELLVITGIDHAHAALAELA